MLGIADSVVADDIVGALDTDGKTDGASDATVVGTLDGIDVGTNDGEELGAIEG